MINGLAGRLKRPETLRYLLIVLLIFLLGIWLRVAFFRGMVFDESISIAEEAWELFTANPISGSFMQFLRALKNIPSSNILPVFVSGLLYQLFGVSDIWSVIFPILSSLLVGGFLYSFGSLWHSRSVGLLALFFWLMLPINVFLSSNLLPVLPLIALNTLTVLMYLLGRKHHSWIYFVLAGATLLSGLIFSWAYALPNVVFVGYDLLKNQHFVEIKKIGIGLFAIVTLYMLIPPNGAMALNLYYLVPLVFENLFLFPLLILALVYVFSLPRDKRPTDLLIWLAAKAIWLVIGARWISMDPLIETIGISGYWLDLLVPGLVLLAWLFVGRLGERLIFKIVSLASIGLFFFVLFLSIFETLPPWLFTVSRISVGIAFLLIFLFGAAWNSSIKKQIVFFSLFLLTFLVGGWTITNDYWRSYQHTVEDSLDVLTTLETNGEVILFVGEYNLSSRFKYETGFGNPTEFPNLSLTVADLTQGNANSLPNGSYVVMSDSYKNLVFGMEPENWSLEQEIQNSNQQKLFLYKVNP